MSDGSSLFVRTLDALEEVLFAYTQMAASGDAGNWDWEAEPRVIEAQRVLAEARSESAQ